MKKSSLSNLALSVWLSFLHLIDKSPTWQSTYWHIDYIIIYLSLSFIWEVWWNRDNGSNLHAGSWSLAKTQAQNMNWATSQDTPVETIMLPSVLTQSFLYLVPNTSKYLEIHSKGGPEVRPHPHAAVRMYIFWYQDTSELLRLNQHTDIKIQSQSMSLWLRRKALGATSLKAGEETRRNKKKRERERERTWKEREKTWENMREMSNFIGLRVGFGSTWASCHRKW